MKDRFAPSNVVVFFVGDTGSQGVGKGWSHVTAVVGVFMMTSLLVCCLSSSLEQLICQSRVPSVWSAMVLALVVVRLRVC